MANEDTKRVQELKLALKKAEKRIVRLRERNRKLVQRAEHADSSLKAIHPAERYERELGHVASIFRHHGVNSPSLDARLSRKKT